MCMYSAVEGVPQEWHHTHLAQFASGGAGLIVAEATSVVPEGRISPRDTGIWNSEQQESWTPIVQAIHERDGLVGVQLTHAGRKADPQSRLTNPHCRIRQRRPARSRGAASAREAVRTAGPAYFVSSLPL